MLSLRVGRNGSLSGTMRVVAPFRLDGSVQGRQIDDVVRIQVMYENEDGCDGRIEGVLDVARGGNSATGPVTIDDCGAPTAGTLSFRR